MFMTPTGPEEAVNDGVGYQRWSDMLFVHSRVPAHVVAACVPRPFEVEVWEGDAWVGLVCSACRVCALVGLPIPLVVELSGNQSANLRPLSRRRPGVWFFSLEAGNPIAVWVARRRWWLNYFWAQM